MSSETSRLAQRSPYVFGLRDYQMHRLLGNFLWFLHGFTARLYFIFNPTIHLVSYLQNITTADKNAVIICSINVIVIAFGIVLNFSTFTRPNQKYLYPNKFIRQSSLETYQMLLNYNAVMFVAWVSRSIEASVLGLDNSTDYWFGGFLGICALTWAIAKIVSFIFRRTDRQDDFFAIIDSAGIAARKIKTYLTQKEREEFSLAIYQDFRTNNTNLKTLGQILFMSVILATIIQILQTFLGDFVRKAIG